MELSFSFKTGKKAVNKATALSTQIVPEQWGNSWFYTADSNTRAGYEALKSMYEDLPEVQAPVNYIIDKLSNIAYDLVRFNKKGDTKIIEDKNRDLLATPNQYMEEPDFIKTFLLNRIVLGAGYINKIKPTGFGVYKQLYVLPSATTQPIVDEVNKKDPRQNSVKGYTVDFGNGEIKLTSDEVCAQYESNLDAKLDEIRSRLLSAILTSDSLRYNYEARVVLYKNRGALGVVGPADPNTAITKEQADSLRAQWNNETGITGNKAPIRVSQSAINYTNIGMDIKQLQLNENKLQDFQTVCSVLNIDPALFGVGNDTYNNKILAKKNFWEDVGMPMFNSYLKFIGKVVELPDNEKYIADYSEIPALQEDYKTKVEANSKAYNDGAITHEEYRESINFDGGEDKYKAEIDKEASTGIEEEETTEQDNI